MARQINADTPPSLLLRIRDHADDESWGDFVEVYSPMIYSFCRSRGLQANDAADVTQEVLLRLSKAIRNFEYDRGRGLFRDWLARIVLNEIRRQASKAKQPPINLEEQSVPAAQDDSQWQEHFQQHIFQTALGRCKPHFAEETWRLFELSWLQDQSVDEVAVATNCSRDQVYVARSRVLKRLRYEVVNLSDDLV